MKDLDKLTISIEKLQPNSQYDFKHSGEPIDETLFNSIKWVSMNNLTWLSVKAEMDKL